MSDYLLYGADISPLSQRVRLQLEYKGVAFTEQTPPDGLHSETFAGINPIRRIPVLERFQPSQS